jgi:hypothetical protein
MEARVTVYESAAVVSRVRNLPPGTPLSCRLPGFRFLHLLGCLRFMVFAVAGLVLLEPFDALNISNPVCVLAGKAFLAHMSRFLHEGYLVSLRFYR